MARLNPMIDRSIATKKQYLGKMILFCEGTTEYNYFNHFALIINGKSKYSHIKIEFEKVEGNAKTVFNKAEEVIDNNLSKYSLYEKYLIFDCDDPKNIQEVINDMKKSRYDYKLLLTNLLFETWLLMHIEKIDKPLTKAQVYKKLRDYLEITRYTNKQKSSQGMIRKIIGDGKNVIHAIENAKDLEKKYKISKYEIYDDINKMNPYTSVHNLVEKILLEI